MLAALVIAFATQGVCGAIVDMTLHVVSGTALLVSVDQGSAPLDGLLHQRIAEMPLIARRLLADCSVRLLPGVCPRTGSHNDTMIHLPQVEARFDPSGVFDVRCCSSSAKRGTPR